MLAGAAHVDFTPLPGLILQGHYTTQVSTGVLHRLEARGVAFCLGERTVIVIALDVIGVSRETTGRIRQRLRSAVNIHPNNVMVCASHTHCAPATIELLGMTPDPGFLGAVEDAAVLCATRAIADLRPARMGVGCSSAHFNVNRRPLPGATTQFSVNYAGVVDKRVRVLRVEDGRGRPLAVLFHYSCHPTTLPGSRGLISSDYPGVARGYIEHEFGCPALFVPGCFGNIRPLIIDGAGEFVAGTPAQLETVGRELAGAVARAAGGIKAIDADVLDARQTDLAIGFRPTLTVEELEAVEKETAPAAMAVKRPWARRVIRAIGAGELPGDEQTAMQLLRIGPVSLISIPGEPVQEIGNAVERIASSSQAEVWPAGYTNDMLGYLVTERQKLEGGYEPTAYPYFGKVAGFAEEQSQIEAGARRLFGVGG